MTYYIWFDESDKDGMYYSNFYGGILIKSTDVDAVLRMSKCKVEELGLTNEEIKWQKVNAYTYEKYCILVDFIFDLLENGLIKIRIFFRNNQYEAIGLSDEHRRNRFSYLYYQFIKHSFGLQYSNQTNEEITLKLFIDDIPMKGADKVVFEDYLYRLNNDKDFKDAKIKLLHGDIQEVNSKKHIPLQLMDLILGSICFRLNDKHKIKDPETGKRGTRTKLKEQLFKQISKRIRKLRPNFNIGESTGIKTPADRWNYPYSHWSFKPTKFARDFDKSKSNKKR